MNDIINRAGGICIALGCIGSIPRSLRVIEVIREHTLSNGTMCSRHG